MNNTSEVKKSPGSSFLKGAAILGIAALVIKVLGAFFRIPLGNIIGSKGMGYYQGAYAYYNQMLAVSTAGVPTAIAKIISERLAVGNEKSANKVLNVALHLMLTIGIIGAGAMYFLAPVISEKTQNVGSMYSMLALVPALVFVSLLAVYRGYFQGRQHMQPYAISQVFEQFVRVIIGLSLALILMGSGAEYAAAGATFGASAGSMIGFVILYIMYRKYIKKNKLDVGHDSGEKSLAIVKEIFLIAIPISIGASVMPIMGIFDASMVIVRLTSSGFDLETAQGMYGSLSGFAQSIVNLPQIVTAAVQISIVPAIAKLKVLNDEKGLSHNVEIGLRLAMLIGLPCAVGIGLLSFDIMKLLYPLQPGVWKITGGVLGILGWSIVFLSTYQISTGIIQGMGKPVLPAINLFVGALSKMVLTYVLVGMPSINIYGAAIATASAFAIASILNVSYILFIAKIKISYSQVFVKPVIDVIAMGITVKMANLIFGMFLPDRLNTVFTILVAGAVYVIMIFVTNTITKEELDMMPGGAKLAKLSEKLSYKKKI